MGNSLKMLSLPSTFYHSINQIQDAIWFAFICVKNDKIDPKTNGNGLNTSNFLKIETFARTSAQTLFECHTIRISKAGTICNSFECMREKEKKETTDCGQNDHEMWVFRWLIFYIRKLTAAFHVF